MMKFTSAIKLGIASFSFYLVCLTAPPCEAQNGRQAKGAAAETAAVQVSAQEVMNLVGRIKSVDSPTFRAYLYSRLVTQFRQSADNDPGLRQVVLDAARAGISDMSEHANEIPQVPSDSLYGELLGVIRRYAPEEAERLKGAHPLKRDTPSSSPEESRNGVAFYAALDKLLNPQTAEEGARDASSLIAAGKIPASTINGALSELSRNNSPALPLLLAATLALGERSPSALPPSTLFFLSYIYLKDTTAIGLQARFLAVADKATQLDPERLALDPVTRSWVVKLLQRSLPRMQQLTAELYPAASVRYASLANGAPLEDPVYSRIKSSDDPLGQTIIEADLTKDPRLKGELMVSAARLAIKQGNLRQATELVASADDSRGERATGYSARDELLDEIVQAALDRKDLEVARYAASKAEMPTYRAGALGRIARYLSRRNDAQAAAEALREAAKALDGAKASKEKAISYLRLVTELAELDGISGFELAREAIKAANEISLPGEDKKGEETWKFFPLADTTTSTFRQLARKDRAGALSLADSFSTKEFKIVASLGAYGLPVE